MIFLDNASTTPLCKKAVEELVYYSTESFFNPSANYSCGFENHKKIDRVKSLLCEKLGVKFDNNIIFTGSATEATNLAIFGSYRKNWKKAIFSAGEHPSVYNCALELVARGVEVVFVDLDQNGRMDMDKFEKSLSQDVDFISVMQVSNETGAINDLKLVSELKNTVCPNAILHCDGVQAFGKIQVYLPSFNPDFYTISAHKFHGPKGLGALYAKNPKKLKPIILGGGQEYNLRSGTENVPAIMALGAALEEINASKNHGEASRLISLFKAQFLARLDSEIPVKILSGEGFSPYVLSISLAGIKGEVLQNLCDYKGLLISTGSACSSKKSGNRILENIGYSKAEVIGNVRVSISRLTTETEIFEGAKILAECANELWRNTR